MVKAWCVWCECPEHNGYPKNGYLWIHEECANKLIDVTSDVKTIREILEGKHPRNEKIADKLDCIVKFLADMDAFTTRWDGTMKIINELRGDTPTPKQSGITTSKILK